jgi:hypothetical protein
MVQLARGIQGLLVKGPAGTTTALDWIEGGVFFSVVGPADSFSVAEAKRAANTVIAAAG